MMDEIKKPAMILSVANTVGLFAVYKLLLAKIEVQDEATREVRKSVASLVNQVAKLQKDFKVNMSTFDRLGEELKTCNDQLSEISEKSDNKTLQRAFNKELNDIILNLKDQGIDVTSKRKKKNKNYNGGKVVGGGNCGGNGVGVSSNRESGLAKERRYQTYDTDDDVDEDDLSSALSSDESEKEKKHKKKNKNRKELHGRATQQGNIVSSTECSDEAERIVKELREQEKTNI